MSGSEYGRVSVLLGGPSAERDVSLRSGAAVARGLRAAGYEVTEIDVVGHDVDLPTGTEAVFIALHGEFGEDGQLQQRLEERGIPYTGSGPDASRAAFDKTISKRVFSSEGIPTPAYEILSAGGECRVELPLVVKPACQGSTIGVHVVREPGEWAAAFADALTYGPDVVVETYVPGRELTVGIVADEALPVVEIRARDGWYDYEAKYTQGMTEYLVPAPLDDATAAACREIGLRAYRVLGCRGVARADFRLSPDGAPFLLEINTIPGFTETSLLPKAASAAGITFPALCDRIMRSAACLGPSPSGIRD